MDDDLDFSNDELLRTLQSYKQQTEIRLNECRDGLQATVDQISHIEQQREVQKQKIEKEFEKTKLQILYVLNRRKKQLLKTLDKQIDIKREMLLNRVQIYQKIIIEAADLQPEILRLEKYELNNNQHIIHSPDSVARRDSINSNHSHSAIKFHENFNNFINSKFKNKNNDKMIKVALPKEKPPRPPTINHDADFMAVPPPSLHNLPIQVLQNNEEKNEENKQNENDNQEQVYKPSNHSKKRLLLELERYFHDKPPQAHKPRVVFICNRKKFIMDQESRFNRYGQISATTGSSIMDIQDSINTGVKYLETGVTSIVGGIQMIANGFKKKQEIKELKTIPPPLLIVYLDPIEKSLAEEFGELITMVTNELGAIISVINYNDEHSIKSWLDPSCIQATKIDINSSNNKNDGDNVNENEIHHENDYAYNPDLHHDEDIRSVLRVCILLYNGEIHESKLINNVVNEYSDKYNLRSISGVELKKVSDKPPINISNHCPNCYIGGIFYDTNDGIVVGQETIFHSIAKCVFSPNNEFEDDEINEAIDKYESKNNPNNHSKKNHQSFRMM